LEWDVVLRGVKPEPPSTKEEGKKLETSIISNAHIVKREALDTKAVYSLYCKLSLFEYNQISSCESAEEIGIDCR